MDEGVELGHLSRAHQVRLHLISLSTVSYESRVIINVVYASDNDITSDLQLRIRTCLLFPDLDGSHPIPVHTAVLLIRSMLKLWTEWMYFELV